MFIAMNRFRITTGREEEFINIWKNRKTYLDNVPGFKSFHLLRGATADNCTLFASHSIWDTRQDFENWTKSTAFRQAHANAGQVKSEGLYQGPPNFEGFEAVL